MNVILEYVLAGGFVLVVLFVTYSVGNAWSRRRVAQDFKQPEDVLMAADVYAKYGRRRAAIELLRDGLERNPDHTGLRTKLAELEAAAGARD